MVFQKHHLMYIMVISLLFTAYFYKSLQESETQTQVILKDIKGSICEVIHIGIVCITQSHSINVYTMLKSLFLNRNNPIHLHIMVNEKSKRCLSKLFETWLMPQVEVSFYNTYKLTFNTNISENVNMFKIILPEIIQLPAVKKIILLSTDIVINDDISGLWGEFEYFYGEQVLGIPLKNPNEADMRLDADIILYHLDNLRAHGWTSNVKNTVPCVWNSKYYCSTNEYKVINRNRTENIPSLIISSFENLDGNTVRKINNNCRKQLLNVTQPKKRILNMCTSFPHSEIRLKRTLLYFYNYSFVSSDLDVTLISQLSFDRLHLLEEYANCWEGPMSLAIYLTDVEYIKCKNFIGSSKTLKNRHNIGYHAVFHDGYSHHTNYLRNVALNEVNTPYVFLNDIDFFPMHGLYPVIKSYLNETADMDKKALVVPAFQTKKFETEVPSTMKQLLKMWDKRKVVIFKFDYFPQGHIPTNYKKWRTAKKPYQVQWKYEYEPYVVVKSNVVKYDERFFAYGWNKIAHIMELKAQGYSFLVLPNTFVVHKMHLVTREFIAFLTSKKFQLCLKSIKTQFTNDIEKKYGKNSLMIN